MVLKLQQINHLTKVHGEKAKLNSYQQKDPEILKILIKKYLGEKESTLSKFLRVHCKNEIAIEITPTKIFHYDYSKRMKGI